MGWGDGVLHHPDPIPRCVGKGQGNEGDKLNVDMWLM